MYSCQRFSRVVFLWAFVLAAPVVAQTEEKKVPEKQETVPAVKQEDKTAVKQEPATSAKPEERKAVKKGRVSTKGRKRAEKPALKDADKAVKQGTGKTPAGNEAAKRPSGAGTKGARMPEKTSTGKQDVNAAGKPKLTTPGAKGNLPITPLGKYVPPPKKIPMKETPLGIIEIEFYQSDAPRASENFLKLTEKRYFNGLTFHRIARGYVIQGGDPNGNGTGGKSAWGKEFPDELNPNAQSYKDGYKRGVVAMANRGPNTNTSQFFIMLNDAPRMPKSFTIFGKVVSGMEVVDRIGSMEIIPVMGMEDGKPKVDVVMKTVSIVKMPDGKPHAKIEVVQREPLEDPPAPARGK